MTSPPRHPAADRATPVTRFAYDPPVILAGAGATEELGAELAEAGIESALVVCNRSIGSLPAVLDPLLDGLGHRSAGVFDEVTGDKRLETAWAAARQAEALEADGLVGVGAGSALDVATVAAALVDHPGPFEALRSAFLETGRVPLDHRPCPLVTVPTTLAGAELSQGAGITAVDTAGGEPVAGGIGDPQLAPRVTLHDAQLVAHTPTDVLCRSAMNGFNKGIESLYSPSATPVTDATAVAGLELLTGFLPELAGDPTVEDLDAILEGSLLVQYGASRPDATGLSAIHAFGHGVTAVADVQQGVAHAVLTPAVLRALFDRGRCRRDLIARALGVESAEGIVTEVSNLRDRLGLPDRLRAVAAVDRSMLPAMAEETAADPLLDNLPAGVTLELEDVEAILEAAW